MIDLIKLGDNEESITALLVEMAEAMPPGTLSEVHASISFNGMTIEQGMTLAGADSDVSPECAGLPGEWSTSEKSAAWGALCSAFAKFVEVAPEACHLSMLKNEVDVTKPGATVRKVMPGRVITLSGFLLLPAAVEGGAV